MLKLIISVLFFYFGSAAFSQEFYTFKCSARIIADGEARVIYGEEIQVPEHGASRVLKSSGYELLLDFDENPGETSVLVLHVMKNDQFFLDVQAYGSNENAVRLTLPRLGDGARISAFCWEPQGRSSD